MFPWTYGFHLNAGSMAFLGAFYTVLVIIVTTLVAALIRSRLAVRAGREEEVRWHADFEELPARDRMCRHVLTGEFSYRECPNAFDCRHCETHARLVAIRPPSTTEEPEEEVFGMEFPLDRYYHRGHTWVRPEPDGTATIGVDELGRRLLGDPDAIELPRPGARLHVNRSAWRMSKRGKHLRMLSPVDGEVVEAGPDRRSYLLRVKPLDGASDFRHLLAPHEVRPWILREMERLQLALSADSTPMLADGGVPLADMTGCAGDADWDAVLAEMFLNA